MMVTLDGFIEGPARETDPLKKIDWHLADEEWNAYSMDLFQEVDTLLLGRVNYELFFSYWPAALSNPETSASDREIAQTLNDIRKVVFSKTLKDVRWANATVVNTDLAEAVLALKREPGKDLVSFGGATLASSLAKLGLIDELRLFVNPIVVGSGKPLFLEFHERLRLQLLKTRRFKSGLMGLYYGPVSPAGDGPLR
jgi:dihydrofolate reductase